MKKATQEILKRFPNLDLNSKQDDLPVSLSDVERTFLKLGRFFEQPQENEFSLKELYRHLDNDWLEFALQLITHYFKEDTYLIQNPTFSIVREREEYMNQSQFATYLSEHGLKYDRPKLNMYLKRGKLPDPDQMFAGKPYWKPATVAAYCRKEKNRLNL